MEPEKSENNEKNKTKKSKSKNDSVSEDKSCDAAAEPKRIRKKLLVPTCNITCL